MKRHFKDLIEGVTALADGHEPIKRQRLGTPLNKAKCRQYMMDYAKRRGKTFSGIRADVWDRLQADLRKSMRYCVDMTPAGFKTIGLTSGKRVNRGNL